ncbi:MAG: phosphoesterase [Gemmataceae bacterium]|nr:phosphoesterase [Gemmataceae bacterium]
MMADEQVLGVPLARLEALGRFTGLTTDVARYWPALLDPEHLSFRPRSECETDPSWLQLIPYAVLECGGRVFHYTRGSKGGEARLHALRSVGIGGHINPTDTGSKDSYRAGLERELAEEVELPRVVAERVAGLVYDPATPVGAVHLGVIHVLNLAGDTVRPLDPALALPGMATRAELLAEADRLESWSRLLLEAGLTGVG